jgi:hypothetical protein
MIISNSHSVVALVALFFSATLTQENNNRGYERKKGCHVCHAAGHGPVLSGSRRGQASRPAKKGRPRDTKSGGWRSLIVAAQGFLAPSGHVARFIRGICTGRARNTALFGPWQPYRAIKATTLGRVPCRGRTARRPDQSHRPPARHSHATSARLWVTMPASIHLGRSMAASPWSPA